MTTFAAMDLVWIILVTVLFWRLIGRHVSHWLESFRGVRFLPRRDDEG